MKNNNRTNGNSNSSVKPTRRHSGITLRFHPEANSTIYLSSPTGLVIDATIFGAVLVVGHSTCNTLTIENQRIFQELIQDADDMDCGVLSIEMGILQILRDQKRTVQKIGTKTESQHVSANN